MKYQYVLVVAMVICNVWVMGQDPCALPANAGTAWAGPVSQLLQCFNSIPRNEARVAATLTSLRQMADLYSFTDLAKDSGGVYAMKVDLMAGLDAIEANKTMSDYAFHAALSRLYSKLNDAHTLYMLPSGYRCDYARPLPVHYTPGQGYLLGTNRLSNSLDFPTRTGFNPTPYVGAQLLKIDGLTPSDYIGSLAESYVGLYKDFGVRWGKAMLENDLIGTARVGGFDGLATSNYLTLSLNGNVVNVVAPTLAVCTVPPLSTTSMLDANGYTSGFWGSMKWPAPEDAETWMNDLALKTLVGMDVHQERRAELKALGVDLLAKKEYVPLSMQPPTPRATQHLQGGPVELPNVPGLAANFSVLVENFFDAYFTTYQPASGPILPIFQLNTFLPSSYASNIATFNSFLQYGKDHGLKNAIIDVTGNGGGLVCLANLYVMALNPGWDWNTNTGHSLGAYDFKVGNITDYWMGQSTWSAWMMTQSLLKPSNYLDTSTGQPFQDFSFAKPGIRRVRGGVSRAYSTPGYFPSTCPMVMLLQAGFYSLVDYHYDKVVVVTDGTCGSACSLFVSLLQTYSKDRVRVVSYGGQVNATEPMDTSSFAGGNVLEWTQVALMSGILGDSGPNVPAMLPSSARARFNFNEMYTAPQDDLPREFRKLPADYHLSQWARASEVHPASYSAAVYSDLYASVAPVFDLF